ncbi:MAG: flavin reductase family protein [Armatimonadota bacterium]
MAKKALEPTTTLFPCPAALISCRGPDGPANIITLAWVGVCCSEPPMIGIGIRPHRHSNPLVRCSGEFVVNIPTSNMAEVVDWCGCVSGADVGKFAGGRLTAVEASEVSAPLIAECPINVECVVRHLLRLGTHDYFIGEVVAVHVEEELLGAGGRIEVARLKPLIYNMPEYWSIGERVGTHGFSAQR